MLLPNLKDSPRSVGGGETGEGGEESPSSAGCGRSGPDSLSLRTRQRGVPLCDKAQHHRRKKSKCLPDVWESIRKPGPVLSNFFAGAAADVCFFFSGPGGLRPSGNFFAAVWGAGSSGKRADPGIFIKNIR